MLQVFKNAFALPDLRKRILFTLGILVLYQLAAHVPVPGVNQAALKSLLEGQGATSALANILNLLSGGALSNFSVLAMGVYPYITAQIIIQLLAGVIPSLERMLREEGTAGRKKLYVPSPSQWRCCRPSARSAFSAAPVAARLFRASGEFLPTAAVLATMTAGTFFAIWLGQLITERGIGGVSRSLSSAVSWRAFRRTSCSCWPIRPRRSFPWLRLR
jgi:preprotein translocase subunit SecY